jgi:hypothetical protein
MWRSTQLSVFDHPVAGTVERNRQNQRSRRTQAQLNSAGALRPAKQPARAEGSQCFQVSHWCGQQYMGGT